MINPFNDINFKPGTKEIQKFGNSMIIGLPIIAVILLLIYCPNSLNLTSIFNSPLILIVIGFIIYIISRIAPKLVLIIYYPWYILAGIIGFIISNFLLVVFYYVIFTGIALCLRVFLKRDPLQIRSIKKSTWVDSKHHSDMKRYFKQF